MLELMEKRTELEDRLDELDKEMEELATKMSKSEETYRIELAKES